MPAGGSRQGRAMDGSSPHAVLGVSRDASTDDINRAFRAGALRTHPDRGGCREDFEALVAAVDNLRRQPRRVATPYDTALRTVPEPTWSVYDSTSAPKRPRRRPQLSFDEILRAELTRLDRAA
jgi:hypothetical protein